MQVAEVAQITALEVQLATERERSRRLEAQLRNLADHDPLTDLLNRRSIEHELEVHLARCTRYGPEGALLLVGLDGLDDVAAELGHRESDEVLAVLADKVGNRLRSTDVVGRWASDELAVLLPKTTEDAMAVVAESLVSIVREAASPAVPAGSIVASIGGAPVSDTPVRAEHLADRASRAMVAARGRGGGWVVAAG